MRKKDDSDCVGFLCLEACFAYLSHLPNTNRSEDPDPSSFPSYTVRIYFRLSFLPWKETA